MKSISVIPLEGLGNRLRAIASAWAVAQRYEVPLTVWWNATPNCRCRFADLFEPPGAFEVVEGSGLLHQPASWRLNLRLPHLLQHLRYDQCLRRFNYWPDHDIYAAIRPRCRRLLLETCYQQTPTYPPLASWLRLRPDLQRQVDATAARFAPDTIGLHIRGTDHVLARRHSTPERFAALIERLVAERPDQTFYLATDEPGVKRALAQRYPDRIITRQAPLGRDSREAMQAAIVECYCLARTARLMGSYNSTYSTLAAELGGITLTEVE